jgi:glycosyltransferase involved in cell wall biosynthesis
MRIAMVAACPFPWPRGTPIRIHRMAEALGRRGHDVHVVTYHLADHTATPSMTVHRIAGPRWYMHTAPGPTFAKLALLDPLLTLKLRRLLRKMSFEVIHAHHYEGLLAAHFARPSRLPPVVFDSHTLLENELPQYGCGFGAVLSARAGRLLDRILPTRAQHVVAVSDDMRTHYEAAGIPSSAITVISNGVEAEHFRANNRDPDGGPSLAFAGNLARYQRVDLLLEAFAMVHAQDERARLRIVTSDDFGPFAPVCERLGIGRSVEVRDVDYDALPAELARATVLANPRIDCSGIPQKLMNYMASGTPVVSFAGSAKLLEHEISGLIVPDGDIAGFATEVLRLMRDAELRRRLGTHTQDFVTREYGWDQVAQRVELVYARIMEAA